MRKFGLIGKSLKHSFSKSYFTQKFAEQNIDAEYLNFELEDLNGFRRLFDNYDLVGVNVTIPYKTEVMDHLDAIDKSAVNAMAVNTVKREGDKLVGYNTDTYGFRQSIKPFFKSHHERALIIGTGGAARAIEHVLEELGVNVIFISRDPKQENHFGYDEINDSMIDACKLIVNCTPVGMYPNVDEEVKIPYEFLTEDHLLYDVIYNPSETVFLRKGKEAGAVTLNGESMLKQQAEKAWEIWSRES